MESVDDKRKGVRSEMRMISRAASILRVLADHAAGLSLGQIAKETDLARATVQRIVGALEVEGFVTTNVALPGVRLGASLARLAANIHADVRSLCRPALARLAADLEETVDLTILEGDVAIVVDQIPGSRALRFVTCIGSRLPLHSSASGKAHLSVVPPEQADRYHETPLRRSAQGSQTEWGNVPLAEQGPSANPVCLDEEGYAPGVCAMGVPIRGLASGNFAVAVSMPRQRLLGRMDVVSESLLRAREQIEHAAGSQAAARS